MSELSSNFNECSKDFALANPSVTPDRAVRVEHFERTDPVAVIQRAIGVEDDGMWGGGTNKAFTQWLRLQQAEHMGVENADGWLGSGTLEGLEGKIDAEVYNALRQIYEDGSYSKLHSRDRWHSATVEEVKENCTLPDEVRPDIAQPEEEARVPEPAAEAEVLTEAAPEPAADAEVQTEAVPEETQPEPVAAVPQLTPGFEGDYQLMFADTQMAYLDFLGGTPMTMSTEDMQFVQDVNHRYDAAMEAYNGGDQIAAVRAAHDLTSFARDGLEAREMAFVREHWDQLYPYFGHIGETVGPQDYERGLEVLRTRQQEIIDATFDHRGADVRELLRDRRAFDEIHRPLEAFDQETKDIEALAAQNGIALTSDPAPDTAETPVVARQLQLAVPGA